MVLEESEHRSATSLTEHASNGVQKRPKPEVLETFHFIRGRVVARLFIFERGAKQFLVKISTLAQISHDWGETSDELNVQFQSPISLSFVVDMSRNFPNEAMKLPEHRS